MDKANPKPMESLEAQPLCRSGRAESDLSLTGSPTPRGSGEELRETSHDLPLTRGHLIGIVMAAFTLGLTVGIVWIGFFASVTREVLIINK